MADTVSLDTPLYPISPTVLGASSKSIPLLYHSNTLDVLHCTVSMIPPYDPRLFDADPTGYGEFMTIHPHNIVPNYPPQAMITEGPMQDFVFYYDEHSHVPRQVHIGQSDIDEPI